jgi:XFP C-terminal domain/Glycosyl hydrolases family 2, TIM barrel domain
VAGVTSPRGCVEPVVLKGTCNHQDHAGVGTALPDRLQYFRIEKLKEMGSNAYRTAHHPPTPELLDAWKPAEPRPASARLADVFDRVPKLGARAAYAKQAIRDTLIEHAQYIATYGDDLPEVRDWRWADAFSSS